MQNDLNKKMAGAAKWSTITEIGTRLISPITNAVLARLLAPEAFGVVATLTMVTTFAEIFTDAGFQKYLVQHEFQNEEDLNHSTNVAFWTNLFFSLLIWGGIALFATPIASLVGSEGYETSIVVMSAQIPLLAFSSIQLARYRREFDFKNLFVARMVVALVPLFVTIPMAVVFRSHWALVVGTLAKDLLNAIVLTVKSKWKPSFQYDFQKLKDMIEFSMWTILENVSIWLTSNVGTFVVGNLLGTYYLGLYKTTITTVSGYFAILQSAVMPVVFSSLSRCQNDDREFQRIFFQFQRMSAMIVFPLGFGLFVFHDLGTRILLGEQWMETSYFLGMNALSSALVFVFSYFNSEAFRSKGKPRLSLLAQVLYFVILLPMLYAGCAFGYGPLTLSSTLSRLSLLVITSCISWIALGINFLSVIKNVWPSLLSSVIMAAVGASLLTISEHIVWQVISVFVCVIVYAAVMILLPTGRKQLKEIPILDRIISLK